MIKPKDSHSAINFSDGMRSQNLHCCLLNGAAPSAFIDENGVWMIIYLSGHVLPFEAPAEGNPSIDFKVKKPYIGFIIYSTEIFVRSNMFCINFCIAFIG